MHLDAKAMRAAEDAFNNHENHTTFRVLSEAIRAYLIALPAAPATMAVTGDVERLWQELIEKDDRTSPAEYPDMALITFDEFRALLATPRPAGDEGTAAYVPFALVEKVENRIAYRIALGSTPRAIAEDVLSIALPSVTDTGVVEALRTELAIEKARADRLDALVNSPETENWLTGVPLEAAHQIERWGADHDAGKTAWDWFWLVGYLSQKAAASHVAGDLFKAKHHTISTGAAMLNWHRHLTGENTVMRPGIDPVARGLGLGDVALSDQGREVAK